MGEIRSVRLVHVLKIGHVITKDLDLSRHKLLCSQTGSLPLHTLTTLSMLLPASSNIAMIFLQHCAVLSPIEPSTNLPSGVPGIWPDTYMVPPATIAWD